MNTTNSNRAVACIRFVRALFARWNLRRAERRVIIHHDVPEVAAERIIGTTVYQATAVEIDGHKRLWWYRIPQDFVWGFDIRARRKLARCACRPNTQLSDAQRSE